MTSPAWFFSTVSQAMATIIAFMISLIAVLQQLRYDRKKRRIEDFKKNLKEFDRKYSNSTDEVMSLLKEFYDGSVPHTVPEPSKTNVDLIQSEFSDSSRIYPISNSIWLHIYNINNKLDSINSSEEIARGGMPKEEKLLEISDSIDYISGNILKGDNTMTDEINSFVDFEELSIKNDIFSNDSTTYTGLEKWFGHNFSNDSNKYEQNGHNILSLLKYFEQMEKDFDELRTSYEAVTAISDNGLSDSLNYIILILIIGVFLPILSLLSVPNSFVVLSGTALTLYQAAIVGMSAIFILLLLKDINEYLPLEY